MLKGDIYLKKPADFDRVYRQGRHSGHPLLTVKSLPNGLTYPRWGVVVSKKLGTAVVRNLVKRRLREILRQVALNTGRDIIVIARPGAASVGFGDLQQAVWGLFKRNGLTEIDEIASPVVN